MDAGGVGFQSGAVAPDDPELQELQKLCRGKVSRVSEGADRFIHLPGLNFLVRGQPRTLDGLLSLGLRENYATRLYLSKPVPELVVPWSVFSILGETWHTWSWQGVQPNQPLASILAGHLRAFP